MRSGPAVLLLAGWLAACAATGPALPSGADTFVVHCAACHGPVGEGDGPAAGAFLAAMPNLRSLAERNGGMFPREAVAAYIDGRELPAAHGSRYMPVWGEVFDTTARVVSGADSATLRIEAVIAHLESLQYR